MKGFAAFIVCRDITAIGEAIEINANDGRVIVVAQYVINARFLEAA
jgi:hypothetical protein